MTTDTIPSTSPASRKYPPGDAALRKSFAELIADRGWSREQAGVKIGVGPGYVSKYINGSNDFDAANIDRLLPDLFKAERLKSADAVKIFPTFITDRIRGSLETIRKTNDFGLIFSAAGLGKSSGMQLFLNEFPLAIGITASKGVADKREIEGHVFAAVETKGYDNRSTRWNFLVKKLKGSDRPIVLDNGQRLRIEALQWLFDFQDETGVPICILGNPEVLTVIQRNDQMFSRIGLMDEITLPERSKAKAKDHANVETVVDSLLAQMVPEWAKAVRALALQVAWQRGHFRALRKTLTFAMQLSLNGGALADARTAFRAAHGKLVRNYALEELE